MFDELDRHTKVAILTYIENITSPVEIYKRTGIPEASTYKYKIQIANAYEKATMNYKKDEETVIYLFNKGKQKLEIAFLTGYKDVKVSEILNKNKDRLDYSLDKKRITNEELRTYFNSYNLSLSMVEYLTGLNHSGLLVRARKIGIDYNSNKLLWWDSEYISVIIVSFIFSGLSVEEIAKRYELSEGYIHKVLEEHGIDAFSEREILCDPSVIEGFEKLSTDRFLGKQKKELRQWDCSNDFLRQFNNIPRLKFLLSYIRNEKMPTKFGSDYTRKFLIHFYDDPGFKSVYRRWIDFNFAKAVKPSLDHKIAKHNGGTWDLDNLEWIPYFENIAKSTSTVSQYRINVLKYHFGDFTVLANMSQTGTYSGIEHQRLFSRDISYKEPLRLLNKHGVNWDVQKIMEFDDPLKLYFLLKFLLKNFTSKRLGEETPDKLEKLICKFYYDDNFDLQYEVYKYTGLKDDMPSIDHIVPLAKGGTNDIDNLRVVSWFINRAKRDLTLEEFEDAAAYSWNIYKYTVMPLVTIGGNTSYNRRCIY